VFKCYTVSLGARLARVYDVIASLLYLKLAWFSWSESSRVSDTVCVCSNPWGIKQTTSLVILVIQQMVVVFQGNHKGYHTTITSVIVLINDVLRNQCCSRRRNLD